MGASQRASAWKEGLLDSTKKGKKQETSSWRERERCVGSGDQDRRQGKQEKKRKTNNSERMLTKDKKGEGEGGGAKEPRKAMYEPRRQRESALCGEGKKNRERIGESRERIRAREKSEADRLFHVTEMPSDTLPVECRVFSLLYLVHTTTNKTFPKIFIKLYKLKGLSYKNKTHREKHSKRTQATSPFEHGTLCTQVFVFLRVRGRMCRVCGVRGGGSVDIGCSCTVQEVLERRLLGRV